MVLIMIEYIWIVMLALLYILWMKYAIVDTIFVIKKFNSGYRICNLEEISIGFYVFTLTVIFVYSLVSFVCPDI